ncbi:hypothetical protein [Streptomyces luteogriseus]|uniref:hypothetical protein n=1 Tax=Streptomyces luteogriseus TaxID=68233 RepID=UPI00370FC3AE
MAVTVDMGAPRGSGEFSIGKRVGGYLEGRPSRDRGEGWLRTSPYGAFETAVEELVDATDPLVAGVRGVWSAPASPEEDAGAGRRRLQSRGLLGGEEAEVVNVRVGEHGHAVRDQVPGRLAPAVADYPPVDDEVLERDVLDEVVPVEAQEQRRTGVSAGLGSVSLVRVESR